MTAADLPKPWKVLRPLPDGWDLLVGVDTGTYMSAVFVAIPPGDEAQTITIAEFPNYRYVAHEIELIGLSVPEWARWVVGAYKYFMPRKERCQAWADSNTQFRSELKHYKLDLLGNTRRLELRVEIAREYMGAHLPNGQPRSVMAPWLEILPYEIEHAKWPDGTTGAGKFERIKEHDHTLDGYEHAHSRRPRSKTIFQSGKKSFTQRHIEQHRIATPGVIDPHLGSL